MYSFSPRILRGLKLFTNLPFYLVQPANCRAKRQRSCALPTEPCHHAFVSFLFPQHYDMILACNARIIRCTEKLPQIGAESRASAEVITALASSDKLPQVGAELLSIPWGHIKLLIDKCKNEPKKVLFYSRKTIENNWSRAVLQNWLDTDLYERQGKAITNFALTLPAPQSDLAQEMTRDPYSFDFLTIRAQYDEKELKDEYKGKLPTIDEIERKLRE